MKGHCPVCGELAPIGPTGKQIPRKNGHGLENGSASYKIVLTHPDERLTSRAGDIVVETECQGTGRYV